jgi:2'-deoxynucleoside 5'-phosphate N-hydrolase
VKIYFAGSIRSGRDDWALYRDIIRVLGEYGTVLTEHIGNSELETTGETLADREIHDRDLGWLKDSDCLVAEVTTPSLGVGYEIAKATEWSKPVLCLFRAAPGRRLSAMIAGCDAVQVSAYVDILDLSETIKRFLNGGRTPLTS